MTSTPRLSRSGAAAAWNDHGRRPVRLIGLGVSNLQERAQQLRLGDDASGSSAGQAVAALRRRFGERAVMRAAELDRGPRDRPFSGDP